MRPSKYDVKIYQGASWILEATLRDENGDVLDLSGYSGDMVIRQYLEDEDEVVRIDESGGGIVLAATAPNITLRLSATQTTNLPTSNVEIDDWVYEVRLFDTLSPDYSTFRLIYGDVHVFPAVIRD